jgi:hypothetical protein
MPWGNRKQRPVEISDEDAGKAESMAACGLRDQDIAAVLGLAESTMKRKIGTRLQRGRGKGMASVASTAYRMAVGGKHPTMTQFFLRAKGGWRDQESAEVEVDHKGKVRVRVIIPPDYQEPPAKPAPDACGA